MCQSSRMIFGDTQKWKLIFCSNGRISNNYTNIAKSISKSSASPVSQVCHMNWQSTNNSQRGKLLIIVKGPPKYMFGWVWKLFESEVLMSLMFIIISLIIVHLVVVFHGAVVDDGDDRWRMIGSGKKFLVTKLESLHWLDIGQQRALRSLPPWLDFFFCHISHIF